MTKMDSKKIIEEINRHQNILYEKFQGEVKVIAEQYTDIRNTLDEHTQILDSHTEMISSIKEDIEIIKLDIEFIKNDLKKKVDRDEFAALERRLALLESKH